MNPSEMAQELATTQTIDISVSMETIRDDHDEGTWQGFHPASSFESPIRVTTTGSNRSPLSNLAKEHPAF